MYKKVLPLSAKPNTSYAKISPIEIYCRGKMLDQARNRKLQKYRSHSLRLLDSAFAEMRSGRWLRSEELIWGSLTLAVKGVALGQGEAIEGDEAVRLYAARLGKEHRDRRIREAFSQLSAFSETVDQVRESRSRVDYLFLQLDDISAAVERLWELVSENVTVSISSPETSTPKTN